MAEAILSSKNQIVVPNDARKAMGLKPGDRLLVVVRGETVVLMRRPEDYQQAIRGIGKGLTRRTTSNGRGIVGTEKPQAALARHQRITNDAAFSRLPLIESVILHH